MKLFFTHTIFPVSILFMLVSLLIQCKFLSQANIQAKTEVSAEFLLGKIDHTKHEEFVYIEHQYTPKKKIFLHNQAYQSFKKMHQMAKKANIHLTILSAGRSFSYQRSIWNTKWKKQTNGLNIPSYKQIDIAREILTYSAMPGTSRHHWGTEIDFNSFENSYFEKGVGKKTYEWLKLYARDYGFCQVYTKISPPKLKNKNSKQRHYGYNEEKWHWSYMPLSKEFLKLYNKKVSYNDLNGFMGADLAKELKIIKNYVNSIEERCAQ